MFKKLLSVVFILFVIFLILFCLLSCKTDDFVTLQFASWGSETEISILKPILERFEKENPTIKVELMHIPQNYFQKLHLLYASNTAPDVVFINNQYLPIYANAGVLEDLTTDKDFLETESFYEKSLEALTWKNKLYAIPRDISVLVIYYNKDIFDKYDVKYPTKDWDYETFLKTAQKLTHSPNLFGISFEEEPLFYLPYLMSFGLDGVPSYEDKKTKKGINIYADLRKKYRVAPARADVASATMAQLFLQEKIAMHISGRWLVPKYRTDAKFDWDVINFPKGSAGSIVPLDASGWAISKSSKHKDEAKKLVKYLSSKKISEAFTKSGLIVPARIDVANSSIFLDEKLPQNREIFLSVIKNSTPTPVNVNYRETLDKLKKQTEFDFSQK